MYSFLLVSVLLAGLWFLYKRNEKIRGQLMQSLAEELHYTYSKTGDANSLSGSVFRLGESRKMQNVFSGTFEGCHVRIFDYKFKITSGRTTSHYGFTFFEIAIDSKFPTILISSKQEAFTSIYQIENDVFGGSEEVDLEGNFTDFFSVKVTPDRQMEVRQILTPDLMVYLMDTAPSFSFIFSNGRVYIECQNFFAGGDALPTFSTEKLKQDIKTCQYLISKWLPTLTKMNY